MCITSYFQNFAPRCVAHNPPVSKVKGGKGFEKPPSSTSSPSRISIPPHTIRIFTYNRTPESGSDDDAETWNAQTLRGDKIIVVRYILEKVGPVRVEIREVHILEEVS